jgi:hypothetical protein
MLVGVGKLWIAGVSIGLPVTGLAQAPTAANVETQMRNVDFHVDSTIVLRIDYLRGELQPTSPDQPPFFDDKHSFVLAIDRRDRSLGR